MARTSNRNKQSFWYALYAGTAEGYDDYGNPSAPVLPSQTQTSTYAEYGKPVFAKGNISPARGVVEIRQFGDDLDYDKVILMEDRDTPIDEYAVLWIDREPKIDLYGNIKTDNDGNYDTPWDYIVKKVARGLPKFGGAVIAAKKVNVS